MVGSLIQLGKFTLNSGKESDFKLVADEFINDNLDGLVQLVRRMVGPYGDVYGVPRGGCVIAEELKKYNASVLTNTVLIVDNVLTTGGSMKQARELMSGKYEFIVGAVLFARGPCPPWIAPLFQMPDRLFLKG